MRGASGLTRRFRHQRVEAGDVSHQQPPSPLVFAWGDLELGSCGRTMGELAFIPSPAAAALGHRPFCLRAPLHAGLFKPRAAVGRAGPVCGGEHGASPQALGIF